MAKKKKSGRIAAICIGLLIAAGLIAACLYFIPHSPAPAPGKQDDPATPTPTQPAAPAAPALSAETLAQLEGSLTARNILLYDETHDTVLFSRAADEPCYPASLTKLLTAAVAVRYAGEEPFTVDKAVYLRDPQASSAYLKIGMKLTLPQMLDALLLPSGADAAYQLAVTTARRLHPEEELSNFDAAMQFCDLMNETAAEIGAENTFFVNPDGIYHTNHVTTATDMLAIMRYAQSVPAVKEAMSLPSVNFTTEDGQQLGYVNTNRLMNVNSPYYYSYCTGGKTGSTDESGYCLGAVAEKGGVRLYALVFGCTEENARFAEATALFEAGFSAMK